MGQLYKNKLIRTSTIPLSLNLLLRGQLSFLNQYYDVIGVSSSGEELELVKNREKIRTKRINIKREISLLNDIRSLFVLYVFFRKEKPLIVHSITPKAGLLSMIAAKMAGIPIRIHTFTGLIFPSKKGILQKILILMDRVLCKCATHIYPEGNGVKKDLIKYKITTKPLKVLANGNVNGIDTSYFNPKAFSEIDKQELKSNLGIKSDDFVFIFVGRLVSDKGINELAETFNCLSQQYNHIKLLLVGPMEADLDPLKDKTINTINANNNIITVGYQSDICPYLAIADALVFPSYREGFPNVVMQAGAMELPSIVTDINGCNEIIIEGENGVIIPVKNTKTLKEKMELFITDRTLLSKLKANARQMITSRYEQKVVWEALLAEYKSLESQCKMEALSFFNPARERQQNI